jgi:hypothetical protein
MTSLTGVPFPPGCLGGVNPAQPDLDFDIMALGFDGVAVVDPCDLELTGKCGDWKHQQECEEEGYRSEAILPHFAALKTWVSRSLFHVSTIITTDASSSCRSSLPAAWRQDAINSVFSDYGPNRLRTYCPSVGLNETRSSALILAISAFVSATSRR